MRTLLAMILFCGSAMPQNDPAVAIDPVTHQMQPLFTSIGLLNGHYWKQLREDVRVGIIMGITEAAIDYSTTEKNYPLPKLTFGELRSRIDLFYSDDRNLNIPIINVWQIQEPPELPDDVKSNWVNAMRTTYDQEHIKGTIPSSHQ